MQKVLAENNRDFAAEENDREIERKENKELFVLSREEGQGINIRSGAQSGVLQKLPSAASAIPITKRSLPPSVDLSMAAWPSRREEREWHDPNANSVISLRVL